MIIVLNIIKYVNKIYKMLITIRYNTICVHIFAQKRKKINHILQIHFH